MRNLTVILLLYCSIALFATNYTVDTITLFSKVLNENRLILVYKPAVLNTSDTCSIIYLLDGEFSDYRYDRISKEQFIKPVIGIGIVNTNRNRDLLPVKESRKFLKFISDELIPGFESAYKIQNRILYGHSFAGGFTIYAMLNNPGLFDKYIASSATPIMSMINVALYKQLEGQLSKDIKFYFSYGSKDLKQVRKWNRILNVKLKELYLRHIHWKYEVHEGENHNTSDIVTLINGLAY